jgi:leukotriene-A4 hydrolase
LNNNLPSDFVSVFKGWHTNVKIEFLNKVLEKQSNLTNNQYETLRDKLGLHKGYNMEVSNLWYQIALLAKKKDVYPYVIDFLGQIGRMKYIRPIYAAFAMSDRNKAYDVFTQNK